MVVESYTLDELDLEKIERIDSPVVELRVDGSDGTLSFMNFDTPLGKVRKAKLKQLARQDYLIEKFEAGVYRLIKRQALQPQFEQYEGVHYELVKPERAINPNRPQKLLVYFFGATLKNDPDLWKRLMAPMNNPRQFVKNAWILKLADMNLMRGSFYQNTANYPTFETEIQEVIQKVAHQLGIAKEDVVLVGNSKGGTGAVLHGLLGDYAFVASQPVLNQEAYHKNADGHLTNGLIADDLIPACQDLLKGLTSDGKRHRVIFSNRYTGEYAFYQALDPDKITLVDSNNPNHEKPTIIESHAIFSNDTVAEFVWLINQQLLGEIK
jgi:hypothetical protein